MGIPAPIGVGACGLPPQNDQANAVVTGTLSAVGPGKPFAFRGPMNVVFWGAFASALTTTAASLAATTAASGAMAPGAAINSVNVPPGTTWKTFSAGAGTLALPIVTLDCFIDANGKITTPAAYSVNLLLNATVTIPAGVPNLKLPANTTVNAITQTNVAPTSAGVSGGAGAPGLPGIAQLSAAPTSLPINVGPFPLEFALAANAITVGGADAAATFTGAAIVVNATLQIERSFDGGSTWVVCNIGGSGQLAQYTGNTPVSITFGEPEKNVLYRINCTAYTAVSGVTLNYRISQTGGAAESLAIGPLSQG